MKVGKVCTKHPELNGLRYGNGRNCPECAKEYARANRGRARETARARYAANPAPARKSAANYHASHREKHLTNCARWYAANPDKVWAGWLKKLGFTMESYALAVRVQQHRCAVCRCDLRALPTLHVHADHDHLTGLARGVLCGPCNKAIGFMADSPERLINAAWYLMNPTLTGGKQ